MSHTKLPWKITEPSQNKAREIIGSSGQVIAKLTALDIENAELIVKAVNSHDELINTLSNTIDLILFICNVKGWDAGYYMEYAAAKRMLEKVKS